MNFIAVALFAFCMASTSIAPSECHTVVVGVDACFGISSPIHRTHLLAMSSGSAYALKTVVGGIPLTGPPHFNSAPPHACAFAFAIPTHPQFHSVTAYVTRAQLNSTFGTTGEASLVFIGNSQPTLHLSTIRLTTASPVKRNFYLDTKTWPRNSTLIYMFLLHGFVGRRSGTASLYLEIALTPTFRCVLTQFYVQGSRVNLRNPYEVSLANLNEMFHPGWLICTPSMSVSRLEAKVPYRFVATCIDYQLSCDGFVNCPRGPSAPAHQLSVSAYYRSADEYSRGLICYTPSVNWFLLAVILFGTINVALLFLISYVGLLRRYSPLRYLYLQSAFLHHFCCCLPARWRQRMGGGLPTLRRNSVSSNDLDIPLSPPTYANVEEADKANLLEQRPKHHFWWRREKAVAIAKSGHHLPPSYSDVNEEIGVSSDGMIQKIRDLQSSPTYHLGRGHGNAPSPMKPQPQRLRRAFRQANLGVELRTTLRRTLLRSRALVSSGFRILRLPRTPRPPPNRETEPFHEGGEASAALQPPPPDYSEFIGGDFHRPPTALEVDHCRPQPSSPVERPLFSIRTRGGRSFHRRQ